MSFEHRWTHTEFDEIHEGPTQTNQSFNQALNQSINQSIIQSIKPSIKQSIQSDQSQNISKKSKELKTKNFFWPINRFYGGGRPFKKIFAPFDKYI